MVSRTSVGLDFARYRHLFTAARISTSAIGLPFLDPLPPIDLFPQCAKLTSEQLLALSSPGALFLGREKLLRL
jgi:hypothetical protein